jgi:hypothetical protein
MNKTQFRKEKPSVPYSSDEVKRQINYYAYTCGFHRYAGALREYLGYLLRYESNKLQYPPAFPNFALYQPSNLEYKRPARYQGLHITLGKGGSNHQEFKVAQRELTLLEEVSRDLDNVY